MALTNFGFSGGGGGGSSCPALTSVGLTTPSAFCVPNSPLTANGSLNLCGAGSATQYVRGDGTLADFPIIGGGGGVVLFFNGNTSQGAIGGNTYYQLGTSAATGASANFTTNADGVIARFITNTSVPSQLVIPAGTWNF